MTGEPVASPPSPLPSPPLLSLPLSPLPSFSGGRHADSALLPKATVISHDPLLDVSKAGGSRNLQGQVTL